MTDNGPAQVRFNAGLRGWKGSIYDGGIRVPFFIRWPGHLPAGHAVDRIAAHIDVLPTLLDACGISPPAGLKLDGKSLLPLLRDVQRAGWKDRTLYFQWHRGDQPEADRAFAARSQRFKLLRHEPIAGALKQPALELYDMEHDPLELHNVAAMHPDVVSRMHAEYLAWFKDVSATRGFSPIRIEIGGTREDPTVLTRQDWRGPRAGWNPNDLGYWEVDVARAGRFDVTLRMTPRRFPTVARLALGKDRLDQDLGAGTSEHTFKNVAMTAGPGRLEAWVEGNGASAGVLDVTVGRAP
jgi:hypothetical protein